MADSIHLEIVTPASLYFSGKASMVVIPGTEGDLGVLPNHAPLISHIRPGTLVIHKEGAGGETVFINGGYADVTPERCTILTQEVLQLQDITPELIEKRRNETNKLLRHAETDIIKHKAEAELAALAVMETVRKAA